MNTLARRQKWIDLASLMTLLITVGLFVIALFKKGLTHEILLEAGVFLVSVKLVLATQKSHLGNQAIEAKLDLLLRNQYETSKRHRHAS